MFEPLSFVIQVFVFLSYIPITFLAYRRLREPKRYQRAQWELSQIADEDTAEFKEAMATVRHSSQEYLVPLAYITVVLTALYAMTHPVIIQSGIWTGLLEENVGVISDLAGEALEASVLYGRFLFWAWLGAYIYSVERTIRHYLANDLNPSVYISATKRFVVAFVVASILAVSFTVLGDINIGENSEQLLATDTRLVSVYLVCFITGLFPERGMRWLVTTAGTLLGGGEDGAAHLRISEIQGISYWHRGRLEDEGIENVQNLATAQLLRLVVRTPYDVGQIVDWVDQAVLLTYTSPAQQSALSEAGLTRASTVLQAASGRPEALAAFVGLSEEALGLITTSLTGAPNMKPIYKYRGLLPVVEAVGAPTAPVAETGPLAAEQAPAPRPVGAVRPELRAE